MSSRSAGSLPSAVQRSRRVTSAASRPMTSTRAGTGAVPDQTTSADPSSRSGPYHWPVRPSSRGGRALRTFGREELLELPALISPDESGFPPAAVWTTTRTTSACGDDARRVARCSRAAQRHSLVRRSRAPTGPCLPAALARERTVRVVRANGGLARFLAEPDNHEPPLKLVAEAPLEHSERWIRGVRPRAPGVGVEGGLDHVDRTIVVGECCVVLRRVPGACVRRVW